MLHRLWLTDDQLALVGAALKYYRNDLQYKFDTAMSSKDSEAAENINNSMNILDDIFDLITED